jgi:hypothetical protein
MVVGGGSVVVVVVVVGAVVVVASSTAGAWAWSDGNGEPLTVVAAGFEAPAATVCALGFEASAPITIISTTTAEDTITHVRPYQGFAVAIAGEGCHAG